MWLHGVLQEGGSSPALAVPVVWGWRGRSDGVHRQAGEAGVVVCRGRLERALTWPLPGTWNPSEFLW